MIRRTKRWRLLDLAGASGEWDPGTDHEDARPRWRPAGMGAAWREPDGFAQAQALGAPPEVVGPGPRINWPPVRRPVSAASVSGPAAGCGGGAGVGSGRAPGRWTGTSLLGAGGGAEEQRRRGPGSVVPEFGDGLGPPGRAVQQICPCQLPWEENRRVYGRIGNIVCPV